MTWANNDKTFGEFAGLIVGNANNSGVHDGRMFHQQRLNFGRSDTKTFVFDHFFLTVDDVGVALSIDMSDIAGVKPAVAQGTSRFFGGFPVALHDLRAAN